MRETVLLINFRDEEKLRAVESALIRAKVLIKEAYQEDFAQPVGYLAGIKELHKEGAVYEGQGLEKEILVFAFTSEATLDNILKILRQKPITRVDYKAVLTPTNMSWDVPSLYNELAQEHAAFARQGF